MIKFVCPQCLQWDSTAAQEHFFRRLSIRLCSSDCKSTFKITGNKLEIHRSDETWDKCLAQVKAVRLAEKESLDYINRDKIPPPKGECRSITMNQKMFNICLKILGGTLNKTFLEIGGLTGWAAQAFIKEGAGEGVIIDIDKKLLMPSTNEITSIIGDGYYLPLEENQFDFVFDCSSLHHFEDKVKLLQGIKRVLKPNGYYISQGNPPREGANDDDRERYWKNYGLIETMPKLDEYQNYFTEVFGNFSFEKVEDNIVMWGVKNAG